MVSSVRLFFNNFSHVRPHEQPRICEVEIQVAFLLRNLLIRNLGADFQISWPGNRHSQPPKGPFSKWLLCSLEREGWMTPRGGCRPPELSRSRHFFFNFDSRTFGISDRFLAKKLSVWARTGGFLSGWRPPDCLLNKKSWG